MMWFNVNMTILKFERLSESRRVGLYSIKKADCFYVFVLSELKYSK